MSALLQAAGLACTDSSYICMLGVTTPAGVSSQAATGQDNNGPNHGEQSRHT